MARITDEQHKQINILYAQLGVYSQVAKAMGISAATVKRHVEPGFKLEEKEYVFDPAQLPPAAYEVDWTDGELGSHCSLSEQELADINVLKKEIVA